jgi:hypothetical protein
LPEVDRRSASRFANCVAALVFMARTFTPWALLPAKELGCALDDFTGARVACSAGRALEHTTRSS